MAAALRLLRTLRRSFSAFATQAIGSSGLLIEHAAFRFDGSQKRVVLASLDIYLGWSQDDDIHRPATSGKQRVNLADPIDRPQADLHFDEKVEVAVWLVIAARATTEKHDASRLAFGNQASDDLIQWRHHDSFMLR
jgi:hypothetical protein